MKSIFSLVGAFLIAITTFSQTFVDSTNLNCSYANGAATLYPSPISIPLNVSLNATGNITVTLKYAGDLYYSYEYLSLYGENNFYLGQTNTSSYCSQNFNSQTFSINPQNYQNWLADGALGFGITSTQ